MANIDTYLANIMSAIYGKDVRSSIHDAIQAINDDVDGFVQGAMDTTLTSTMLPAQGKAVGDAVNELDDSIISNNIVTWENSGGNKKTPVATNNNFGINLDGGGEASITSCKIMRYSVTPGNILYLDISDSESPTKYVFKSTNSGVTTNNVGGVHTKEYHGFAEVPSGAYYLFIAVSMSDNTSAVYDVEPGYVKKLNLPKRIITITGALKVQNNGNDITLTRHNNWTGAAIDVGEIGTEMAFVRMDTPFTFTLPGSGTYIVSYNTGSGAWSLKQRANMGENDCALCLVYNGKIIPLDTCFIGNIGYVRSIENPLAYALPISGSIETSWDGTTRTVKNISTRFFSTKVKGILPAQTDNTLTISSPYVTFLILNTLTNELFLTTDSAALYENTNYEVVEMFYGDLIIGIAPGWFIKNGNAAYENGQLLCGYIFAFVSDQKLKVRCTSTARIKYHNETLNCSDWELDQALANPYAVFLCANSTEFYVKSLDGLKNDDYVIAIEYNYRIYSFSEFVIPNAFPIPDLYQRSDIPMFINKNKLRFSIGPSYGGLSYCEQFGYFYKFLNCFRNTGAISYFDKMGRQLSNIPVTQNASNIENTKILTIGDSVTNRGWYQTRIKTHVPSAEFVGTRVSQYHNNIYAEGYSGKKAYDVLASPTIELLDSTIINNPFWDPSALKCDFEYYCTSQNIHPDIVIIEFGLNETDPDAYRTSIKNFIETIVAYNNSIKIYVLQPFSEVFTLGATNLSTEQKRYALDRCLLESYSFNNCVLIPAYFIMVDEYDYNKADLDYGYANVKVPGLSDGVHPSETVGFAKLGDMIYNYLGI